MSFLSGSPSVKKPTPLPATPIAASFIARGSQNTRRGRPIGGSTGTPVIGRSGSRVGRPSLLGGGGAA